MQENNIFENENTSGENSSPEVKEIPETAGVVVPNVNYVQYIPYGFTPKTFEEKQGIRKAANVMSISLLLMLGISLLWSFVYIFVMLGLGFSYEKAVGILEDPAILQVLQIVLSAFLFTVPFIIVYKIGRYRISDLVPFEKPAKGDFLPLFLLGVSFCSFANIAVSYAGAIFEAFGINYEVDYGENPEGFFGFMLSLIATVIVPALVEELACRGLLLGSLRKFGDGFAVLVSAIMFGIMHGNFEQMPFAFLVGLVLGFITVKSGTIWIAAAVHGFNNFISVFFDYFMDGFSMLVQNISYLIFLSFSLLVGILGICLLRKRDSEFFKFTPSDTETGEKRKYKLFFTTPLVIIFIIISVLESLVYLS